ncbi:tetratricopeptide repeat protein [Catalinimonas sp. 4WD22]|uniref:tetratricopeptide repeat protein n=1 Tax=Catalinimonas locisalis TaxID=3133978 RepID=UPI0031012CDC
MGLNKQTLINLMSYPNEISDSEVAELVETIENYPYFQLARSLFAKALHDKQAPNAYDALSKAAIYAPNRSLLKALFYEDLHIDRNADHAQASSEENIEEGVSSADEHHSISSSESFSTPESYEPPVDSDTSLTAQEDEVIQSDEVYNELEENLRKLRESKNKFSEDEDEEKKKIADSSDSLHDLDASSSDAPSSIVLEELANQESVSTQFGNNQQLQNELIDKFINSQDNLSLKIKPSSDEVEEVEDLSHQSTEIGDNLVSENLAKIYARQGKKDKAIEIYQKLIWKYPQKKAYFAETIESLKAE